LAGGVAATPAANAVPRGQLVWMPVDCAWAKVGRRQPCGAGGAPSQPRAAGRLSTGLGQARREHQHVGARGGQDGGRDDATPRHPGRQGRQRSYTRSGLDIAHTRFVTIRIIQSILCFILAQLVNIDIRSKKWIKKT